MSTGQRCPKAPARSNEGEDKKRSPAEEHSGNFHPQTSELIARS